MPNKSYRKGCYYERKVIQILEKDGYYCLRTAGSHSEADIISFSTKDNTEQPLIRFIQCKASKYVSKGDIKKLKMLRLPTLVSKELWHFKPKLRRIDCNAPQEA